MAYDLVIHNGTIVTVNDSFEIIPNGLICVKGGKLERVENMADNRVELFPRRSQKPL